jgi:hypothetical protein
VDKAKQLDKLGRFAQENADVVSHVEIVCSRQMVAEVYLNIVAQQVKPSLRKYLTLVLTD